MTAAAAGAMGAEDRRSAATSSVRSFVHLAAFVLLYYLLSRLGAELSQRNAGFAPFWLPSGLFLSALLLVETRRWATVAATGALANLAFDLIDGRSLLFAVLLALANVTAAVGAAALVRRFVDARPEFRSVRQSVVFVACVTADYALIAPLGAWIDTLQLTGSSFRETWWLWLSGDVMGALLLCPLLLGRPVPPPAPLIHWARWLEALAIGAVVVVLGAAMFAVDPNEMLGWRFLLLPPVMWAGMRFGARASAAVTLSIALLVAWSAQVAPPGHAAAEVQILLCVVALVGLLPASGMAQLRRTEAELRAGRELLSGIIEGTSDVVFLKDTQGRYLHFNHAAEEAVGMRAADVLGRDDTALFSPEAARQLMAIDRQVMATGERRTDEEAVTFADGRRVTYLSLKGPIFDDRGRISGSFGIARDISTRKRAEETAREAAMRLRLALDSAHLGTWDWDMTSGHCVWDEWLRELHGLTADSGEVTFQTWLDCVHPEDVEHAMHVLQAALDGRGEYEVEYRTTNSDGSIRYVRTNGLVLRDDAGRPVRMIGLARDITETREAELERARLEAQFYQSQRMESIGRLAGGIAHDFNNLLTPIQGFAQLLRRQAPREQCAMLDSIIKASQTAANLTAQLLAYSGKSIAPGSALDVAAHIAGLRELLRTTASGNVEFIFDLPDALPLIVADPGQISQIVLNLVQNGVEAIGAEAPGRVTVKAASVAASDGELWNDAAGKSLKPGAYVSIQVADTGCGMTEDVRRQIFEPFYTTHLPGRGLGLAAVSGIANGLGGGVRVESGPGTGSAFTVYLPVRPPNPPA